MSRKIILVLAIPLFVSFSGCKKSSSDHHDNPVTTGKQVELLNVAGNWSSQDAPTDPDVILFSLSQTGSSVTGTFNLNSGSVVGTISGSVTDTLFSFTLTEPAPCAGTFKGSAVLNKEKLEGNFKGTDCDGTFEGTFQMHRI